jgi:FKBP-type peptidyl-prolyl cis-trans isomerase FklB
MKKTIFAITLLVGTALVSYAQTPTPSGAANTLTTDQQRESYALGMSLGHSVKQNGIDIDPALVERGIRDEVSGGATLLSEQDAMAAINTLRSTAAMNHQKMVAEEGQKNSLEGAAFLAENKNKPGVVTLPDGLQYKVISEASGDMPGPDDTVTVNYRGTFIDGTEFDSSTKQGHPISFPVRGVIRGWTEALQKMTVGSKWELYIPAELAYGAQGPGAIGPNRTLIFEVELLSISHPTPPVPRQPLTSDIIKVPSAEEMKNGAKIETIKASDVEKMQQGNTN